MARSTPCMNAAWDVHFLNLEKSTHASAKLKKNPCREELAHANYCSVLISGRHDSGQQGRAVHQDQPAPCAGRDSSERRTTCAVPKETSPTRSSDLLGNKDGGSRRDAAPASLNYGTTLNHSFLSSACKYVGTSLPPNEVPCCAIVPRAACCCS